MAAPNIPDHFEEQAGWCRQLGSPFTAELLMAMRADFMIGGVVHTLVGDWAGNPRADALGLRLAGALHFLVLSGQSTALADVYPKGETGWDMEIVWPVANDVLLDHQGWVLEFIQSAPQTNETRRAFMLLIGLKTIAKRFGQPIHLLELGGSAGLNQNFDAFHYDAGSWQWGDPASPMKVTTEWDGDAPDLSAPLTIQSRKACDLNPLDISDPATRLRVKSYVWADQPERLNRFDAAADIAIERGTKVEKADAADWLKDELANRPDNAVTVIFHSVFFQYPPLDVRQDIIGQIETAGGAASPTAPVCWLRYEPGNLWDRSTVLNANNMVCDLRIWPGDEHITLARSDGHVRKVEAL